MVNELAAATRDIAALAPFMDGNQGPGKVKELPRVACEASGQTRTQMQIPRFSSDCPRALALPPGCWSCPGDSEAGAPLPQHWSGTQEGTGQAGGGEVVQKVAWDE